MRTNAFFKEVNDLLKEYYPSYTEQEEFNRLNVILFIDKMNELFKKWEQTYE